ARTSRSNGPPPPPPVARPAAARSRSGRPGGGLASVRNGGWGGQGATSAAGSGLGRVAGGGARPLRVGLGLALGLLLGLALFLVPLLLLLLGHRGLELGLGEELERGRVDAVAQAGRRGAVVEDVAEVGAAVVAHHLDPRLAPRVVGLALDLRRGERLVEARPA